ncbi:hypothetical protein PGH26_13080 [Sporosarcina jeotgali]|uniref:Uncharacterized protein n=1 Tax=Sporosarcina jeotgali TaxID=3020056 RepID=A0ABZ0KUL2_9BACL|nr:hypothetical protein [Sporosarcina sp. B2O-1]WOV83798.1 hypothetical protein PGH26_13080 [Sporosarcina sp. B2O-1]
MNLFILGVFLVFIKTNLQLLDTGVCFYVSNAAGYLLIYAGIRQLREEFQALRRLAPYVLVMVLHSVGFAVLNGTGHSIQTISLSGSWAAILAVSLALLAVAGMGMIFYILHEVITAVRSDDSSAFPEVGSLEKMPVMLFILLLMNCVLFFAAPSAASILMIILLGAEVMFIASISAKVRTI